MVTKKELKDFSDFCSNSFGIKIRRSIIEDYIKSKKQSEIQSNIKKENREIECGTNNVKCSYIAFDSAKCNVCPH
jgi:hypothetical protein